MVNRKSFVTFTLTSKGLLFFFCQSNKTLLVSFELSSSQEFQHNAANRWFEEVRTCLGSSEETDVCQQYINYFYEGQCNNRLCHFGNFVKVSYLTLEKSLHCQTT